MIEQILPATVKAYDTFDDPPGTVLFPEEEQLIKRAVEKRRREFTTARLCARKAMEGLGVAPVPVLSGLRGEPLWPLGVIGSITHCAGYRAAALAQGAGTIGIDGEPNEPLADGVVEAISLPQEREMLRRLAAGHPAVCWDRLLFSAKESVYKAWFPLAKRWLDFQDARISVDPVRHTFTAHLLILGPRWQGRRLGGFTGRWMTGNGLIVTAIAVVTPQPAAIHDREAQ
ncbi:4'-phosphopantetheinyl transferase [Nonomuraea sp. NEAU-A123]|uniref:4'-phosphopantetheinyl transferase family protein n=1 Tax=Nonomuraea sp. NEAU-A123 TaxID=2839649 RepID=UPI001BE4A90C|nr:4'-phosphopantetheinyl transferase superfamily protein [Nonomuraea sp. NEAU-A123]MBT2230371.1 4'-phosphopantetheinyl transferase superfamily protein [Nonomuraea sp. NEAU-A123]